MLTRRRLIAAGAAGAMASLIGRAQADTTKLTFCSWGGALSDLEKSALLDPFGKIPEFKFCAAKVEKVAEAAAE